MWIKYPLIETLPWEEIITSSIHLQPLLKIQQKSKSKATTFESGNARKCNNRIKRSFMQLETLTENFDYNWSYSFINDFMFGVFILSCFLVAKWNFSTNICYCKWTWYLWSFYIQYTFFLHFEVFLFWWCKNKTRN